MVELIVISPFDIVEILALLGILLAHVLLEIVECDFKTLDILLTQCKSSLLVTKFPSEIRILSQLPIEIQLEIIGFAPFSVELNFQLLYFAFLVLNNLIRISKLFFGFLAVEPQVVELLCQLTSQCIHFT